MNLVTGHCKGFVQRRFHLHKDDDHLMLFIQVVLPIKEKRRYRVVKAFLKPVPLIMVSLLLCLPVTPAWGALDHQGTNFLLGFLPNLATENNPELHLISEVTTSVTVEYPVNTPIFTTTVTVSPGATTTVTIPVTAASGWSAGAVGNHAVHAYASEEFVVYMTNGKGLSGDAALGFPVDTMNTTYRVLSALPSQLVPSDRSQFVVVADFDGTEVTITPTGAMAGGFAAGTPFTLTLNKGEGFLGQGTTFGSPGDISGTLIQATRPVGMTNGNVCTNVPQNVFFCDHVFEVAQPVQTWDRATLVGNLPQRTGGSLYRIMASEDGTNVTQDGAALITLNAGQVYTTAVIPGNHVFEADKPMFVAQFMTSQTAGDAVQGDPAMGNMISSAQYSTQYTFSTVPGFGANYVTVLANNSDLATILLDGFPLGAEKFSPIGGTNYSVATVPLTEGPHTTSSTNGHGITVEGMDTAVSYLYPGGVSFQIDGQPSECDVDGDGDVDQTDATLIFAARGHEATGPDDPRNPSGNGIITGQDVQICGLQIPIPDSLLIPSQRSTR
jgi:hypothetical protein